MRHRNAGNHLGRTSAHRTAMARNMAASLIVHERIKTTVPKAKNLRPFVEKLVTLSKPRQGDDVHTKTHRQRLVFSRLRDKEATKKLFTVLGPRFEKRAGGYTRILKLAKRRLGDAGEQAIIEFVERTPKEVDAPPPEEKAAAAETKAAKKAKKAAAAGA
jgi:large subunit ribosomal protein L17